MKSQQLLRHGLGSIVLLLLITGCGDHALHRANEEAALALEQGHPNEAVEILTSLGPRVQKSPVVLVNLGRAYLELGEIDKGLQELHHAGMLVRKNDPLLLLLARIFLFYGEIDEADRMVERCGPTLQETAEYHLVLGHLLLDAGSKQVEVIAELQEALRLRPENEEAMESLLLLLQSVEDPAAMETILSSLPEKLTNSVRTRLLVGEMQARLGQWSEACATAKQVIQLEPNNERAWLLLAQAQRAQGEDEAAEASFETALRGGGRTPAVAVEYARVLLDRREEEKALRFLSAAEQNQRHLPVSERLATVHNLLAGIYARRGQMLPAKQQLLLSLEIQPNQPDIRRFLDSILSGEETEPIQGDSEHGQPIEANPGQP
ncbi:MAG: tetratricopeptide repeat protein [bacterium]